MKALASLCACLALVAAGPALALGHGGPHVIAFPPGHGFHPHGGLPFLNGALGPSVLPPLPGAVDISAPAGLLVSSGSAAIAISSPSACGAGAPAAVDRTGPRIIYIGHEPEIHGPKVIYGAD